MNDRELEGVLEELESSGERFKKSLDSALKEADVAKEDRERAIGSADRLLRSTRDLKKTVNDGKDAAGELGLIDALWNEIRSVVAKHGLTSVLAPSWSPVEAGLQKMKSAFD